MKKTLERRRYGRIVASYLVLFAAIFLTDLELVGSASAKGFLTTGKFTSAPIGATRICRSYSWVCSAKSTGKPVTLNELNQLNRSINRKVYQINDHVQYGTPEKWTLPSRRGGDCEDIALLKKYELIKQGVAPNRLLIATALDKKLRPHAVLVVRFNRGDLVLDSAHNTIMPWEDTGYTFLRMQDPQNPRKWQALLRGGVTTSKKLYQKSANVAAISPDKGPKKESRPRAKYAALDR